MGIYQKANNNYFLVLVAAFMLSLSSGSFAQEVVQQPLTLEESIRNAFASNPDVTVAQERIEQARAAVKQAQAGFYPKLSISENFARTDYAPMVFTYQLAQGNLSGESPAAPPPGFDPFASFNDPDPLSNWNTQLLLRWPLFQGGRTVYSTRAAVDQVEASEAQLISVYNELAYAVSAAFYSILQAEQSIQIAEESARQIRQQLDVATARFENEVALKSDVLRVAVRLAEAENQLVIARHNLERAKSQLNLAMGRNVNTPVVLAPLEAPPPAETLPLEVLMERAKETRPDITAAEHNVLALEQLIGAAKADYYPQVNAFAHYDVDTEDFSDTSDSWMVGVGVSLSLFDGFLTRSNVQQRRAQLREAQAQRDKLVLHVENDVKSAYLARSEALLRLDVLQEIIAEAEENLRIVSERYSEGMALVTDLLDAEVALTNARLQRLAAQYQYRIAAAALERAIGGFAAGGI
ncbi:MAG: TolC family protein [Candidatus Abyssobacteria bacterium SURF_5]|uniref:TolC family protein n=1 Tax=Abyssobacteria bacterium (strain SURF_5) TaxID=2093360 RepID=A0A3A4NQZ2_ABYX5|nr:MAG: TolC family protein [Candidatus Abyssubacteria bacterium SURF_5]